MKKVAVIMLVLIVMISTLTNCCFAASWVNQGYAWARNNNLISAKTTNELLKDITISDYYTILFRYFDLKGLEPSTVYYKAEDYKSDNYILVATDRQLTELARKEWLTNNEFKRAEGLITNARNVLDRNAKYFTQEEITSIKFYLDNIHYILYSKIYDYEYKSQISVKKTNFSDRFIKYRIIPSYGNITREEFLNLMFHFTQADGRTFNTAKTIDFFVDQKVLLGYNNNLMMTSRLNYAHITTFLSRMSQVPLNIAYEQDIVENN